MSIHTTISENDEWIHSSYFFLEERPPAEIILKTLRKYVKFKAEVIVDGKSHLFTERFSTINSMKKITPLEDKDFKTYTIEEIFFVQGTKATDAKFFKTAGEVPRVCCSSLYNGIDGFYTVASTEEGSVITVESAVRGEVHYQPISFATSGHIIKLNLKNREMNVYSGLFLYAIISYYLGEKFSYGYKCNKKRLRSQKIMLPVDIDGDVDYSYMERYVEHEISLLSQEIIKKI